MVAAHVGVNRWRAAEVAQTNNQRFVQQSTFGQIVQQTGERPIELRQQIRMNVEVVRMRVVMLV